MNSEGQRSNPYVGLRPFERSDSLYFFGRRGQVADLLQRLHETHLLAVVGSSGCGKSSLIRAGLIPALLGGFLVEDRERWLIATMKPGGGPIRNLALALGSMEDAAPRAQELSGLAAAIAEDRASGVLGYLKPRLSTDSNLLLLIDQFEEIFAFRGRDRDEPLVEVARAERLERVRRKQEAAEFVDIVLALAEQRQLPVYVVLTMRSDFIGDCDLFYGLPEAMNLSRYLVPRLNRGQLRDAIEGPALLLGQRLAPRLTDALLNELGDRSDRLPILEHALMRAWDVWRTKGATGPVDFEHFEEAGGLREALTRHANEALRDEDLGTTAGIFKCLTDTDPNHRRVRRSAAMSELGAVAGVEPEVVEAILRRFNADGRNFLSISASIESDDGRVEIVHESLIRQWDRLAQWVDEEREARDQFRELVDRARGGRALLRDPDLQIALNWRDRQRPTPAWARRYSADASDFDAAMGYLERSRLARVEEAARRRRNRNLAVSAAIVVGLMLAGLTLYALDSAVGARDAAYIALARQSLESDPTRAALLLLEVSRPERTGYAAPTMRELLGHRIASNILRGHEAPVATLAFSPDGTRIVTGSHDRTARVWSADGSTPPIVLRGHENWVTGASFSPDGARVVTASDDGTARVWRSDGAGDPVVLRGHEGPIFAASFSPDGTHIITGSDDGTARLWGSDGSDEPVVLRGQEGSVLVAKFSPDGARILTGGVGGTARVWSSDGSGEPIVLGKARDTLSLETAAFSPDGRKILVAYTDVGARSTAEVWNADGSGQPFELPYPIDSTGVNRLLAAAFDPDGKRIVTGWNDGTARIYRSEGTSEPLVLRGHEGQVPAAAFSPDGSRIATGGADGTARVWSMEQSDGTVVLRGHRQWVRAASFSPDGSRIVTGSDDDTARVWHADGSGEPVVLRGHEGSVVTASFSPDGGRVVTASDDRTARVWRADGSGEPVVLRGHEGQVVAAAFSPDGSRIVTASDDRTARVWRPDGSGEPVVLHGHDGPIVTAVFSSDGARILTGSDDGTARVWRSDGSGEPVVLQGHEGQVVAAAFSPDGEWVVTTSSDATARVWRADGSGEPVVLHHSVWVGTASFSPDSLRVVTGSDDGTARVWRADGSGEPVLLQGHEKQLVSVAFSRDGQRVLTSSRDGTARVWRADGRGEPLVLRGHDAGITAAAFSPDGARVVTASADGTARVWGYTADSLRRALASATHACLDARFREDFLGESPRQSRLAFEACERRHGRLP